MVLTTFRLTIVPSTGMVIFMVLNLFLWGDMGIIDDLVVGGCLAWIIPIVCTESILWRRVRRRVIDAGYKACIHCGYDLRGLGDSGTCPECSRPFEIDDVVRRWRFAIR